MKTRTSDDVSVARRWLRDVRRHDRLRVGPVLPWVGSAIFAALGLIMIGCGTSWCLEYQRSQHWPRADAFIDRVTPVPLSGDNPDPQVKCDYHFTFGGQQFRGHRVSLTGQGSYAQGERGGSKVWEFEELERHRATGTPVSC